MKKAIITLFFFGGIAMTQTSAQSCSTTTCCTKGKTATVTSVTSLKNCTPEQLKNCTPAQLKNCTPEQLKNCTPANCAPAAAKTEKADKTSKMAVAVKPEKTTVATLKAVASAEK